MAFKVNYRGLEVLCDNPDDVDKLADRLGRQGPVPVADSERPVTARKEVEDVIRDLNEKPRELLRVVFDAKASLTQDDLRKLLSLADNKAVGAVLSQVSRAANLAGFSLGDFIHKRGSRNGAGKRSYQYTPAERYKERIQAVLSEMK